MGQRVRVAVDALTMDGVLQGTFGTAGYFNTNIHPSDQMHTFVASVLGNDEVARFQYFQSGAQLMDALRQLVEWRFGSFAKVGAFLDFASGFGRLTRFLVQQLPADRIHVSDIQAEAVSFQQEQFGVHGFLSATNPADLTQPEKFDCIFVASLFSHLPEATFVPWLRKLYTMLKPDGMLIFSVHDESLLEPTQPMPDSGHFYRERSEIAELSTRDYGTAFVTEAFVRKAIEQASAGQAAYHRIRRLMYYQDLYVLVNKDRADFSDLRFEYGPGGMVDYCYWNRREELCVGGWTVDITPNSAIEEIAVFVNGELKQKCLPFRPRPDVRAHFSDEAFLQSGWECFCHVPGASDSSLLTVTVKTTSSTEYLLYAGRIDALLKPGPASPVQQPAQGQDHSARLETLLQSTRKEFTDLESYARRLEAELEEARAPRLPWKRRPN